MAAKQSSMEVKVRFGRRKLNDAQYLDQQSKKSRSVNASGVRFGKRKGLPEPVAPAAVAPEAGEEKGGETGNPFLVDGGRLSIAKTEARLVEKPGELDLAIHTEFDGVHGAPRKGAVQLFTDIEEAREQPRKRILDLLASAGAE